MVNNSTNINKTNNHLSPSTLNIDGQQLHQYQQNKQLSLTFKFKQWWSTIPPNQQNKQLPLTFKFKQWGWLEDIPSTLNYVMQMIGRPPIHIKLCHADGIGSIAQETKVILLRLHMKVKYCLDDSW